MQYLFGDFVVSVCTFMSRGNAPKGLIVEVQYLPCASTNYGESSQVQNNMIDKLMDEFMSLLAGPDDPVKKPVTNLLGLFDKLGLAHDYSLKHTAIQYVAAFNLLRK